MKVLRTLVCEIAAILMVVGFLCVGAQRTQAQTTFTYPPFPTSIATGLQVNGNASIVTPGIGSNYLQVTPNSSKQVGSAWYTNPPTTATASLSLVNGFTSTFTFQFTNQNTPSTGGSINGWNGTGGADGIAFVVQNGCFTYNNSNFCGSSAVAQNTGTGGEIGFTGLTDSVAVQFDTWCNTEYFDTCATKDPYSSADQITVESCGANANTVNHHAGCSFGTVDLSVLATPIYLADGNVHTAQISYAPPAVAGTCTVTSVLGANGCGSLTVILDGQTVLTVPFNLAYLGLDPTTDDAYVGFTGATGGAWETQDVLSWNFLAGATSVVATPVTIPTTTGTNVNVPNNFSNIAGENQNTNILYVVPKTTLTPASGVNNPVFLVTSLPLSSTAPVGASSYQQYVVGTPWASSQCTIKAVYGMNNYCALYTVACFQSGTTPTNASDALCPTVTEADAEDYIILQDTFDWGGEGKWVPTAGTTASLIAFTVPTSNPTLQWNASPSTTNPVCPTQIPNVTPTCYLADTLINMYGDQTTTKGSKPKSKSWTLSAVNVPMLTTDIDLTAPASSGLTCSPMLNNPPVNSSTFASTIWNNGACILDFVVQPAQLPSGTTNSNYFQAAEPAFLEYGFVSGVAAPPLVVEGPLPKGDVPLTNKNAVLNCSVSPCYATNWDTEFNQSLTSIFTNDGTYTLHWSAADAAGITEKNITLTPASGGLCTQPDDTTVSGTQCYTTTYFTTQVNIDSVAPALTSQGCVQTPASPNGKNGWYISDVYAICYASDATSGIQTATVSTTPPVPLNGPNANVTFNLSTNVGTGNANSAATSSSSQTLCDFAHNCNMPAISIGPFQIDEAPPTISTLTFSAASPYTVGQSVTASFTCADVGSGVASCLGNGSGTNGAMVNTLTTGTYTFTVTATDIAGNVTTSSVNYTVNPAAPAADVAIGGGVTSNTAKSVTYDAWVLDLTKSASASNVVMTFQITAPAGVVGGPIKGVVADVSCSLFGCSAVPPSGGSSCSVTSNNGYTTNTVTCVVGALASVYNLKGAAAQITIPIASTAKVGTQFGISGTVSSANDPNPKNNTTSTTITVK